MEEELSSDEKLAKVMNELALKDIQASHGIFSDVKNEWLFPLNVNEKYIDQLVPIRSYRARVEYMFSRYPAHVEFIIAHGDSFKVVRYNDIANTFNRELPEIIASKNCRRAHTLAELFFKYADQ